MEPRARLHLLIVAVAAAAVFLPPAVSARTLMSQKKALELAFPPGTQLERRTLFLTPAQLEEARQRGKVKIDALVWTYYAALSSGAVTGYAYFDTHPVRTMNETFMAVIEPDGRVRTVELLAFAEPDDYLPRPSWLRQFDGKSEPLDLFVGRAIRNVGGATLTSQALADGVRRVVSVHETLRGIELLEKAQAASR